MIETFTEWWAADPVSLALMLLLGGVSGAWLGTELHKYQSRRKKG
jgi:uncharacterized membrane protein YsdA (DUF1294 family)